LTFGEFIQKRENINNDVLFYACFKAISDIKESNIEDVFDKYVDIALKEEQEYNDAQRIISKLTGNYKNDSNYKPTIEEMIIKMSEEIKRKYNK
jgi:hypothetical protein